MLKVGLIGTKVIVVWLQITGNVRRYRAAGIRKQGGRPETVSSFGWGAGWSEWCFPKPAIASINSMLNAIIAYTFSIDDARSGRLPETVTSKSSSVLNIQKHHTSWCKEWWNNRDTYCLVRILLQRTASWWGCLPSCGIFSKGDMTEGRWNGRRISYPAQRQPLSLSVIDDMNPSNGWWCKDLKRWN